jgi:hypothetical protein
LHVKKFHVVKRGQRADPVGEPGHHTHQVAVQRLDSLGPELRVGSLGNDVCDLVVVAPVDRDRGPPGIQYTGEPGWIAGLAWQPEPPHVHRRAEGVGDQTGGLAQRRRAAVAGDGQRGGHIPGLAALVVICHSGHPVSGPDNADDFGVAQQSEAGFGFGSGGQHLEEIPLRHQCDVFVGTGEPAEVDIDFGALDLKPNRVDEAMG